MKIKPRDRSGSENTKSGYCRNVEAVKLEFDLPDASQRLVYSGIDWRELRQKRALDLKICDAQVKRAHHARGCCRSSHKCQRVDRQDIRQSSPVSPVSRFAAQLSRRLNTIIVRKNPQGLVGPRVNHALAPKAGRENGGVSVRPSRQSRTACRRAFILASAPKPVGV